MRWVEHELLPEESGIVVRHPLPIFELLEGPWLHVGEWHLVLGLKEVLWIVIPFVIILPDALDRGGPSNDGIMIMSKWASPKFIVDLLYMLEGAVEVLVQQRHIFYVPIDKS